MNLEELWQADLRNGLVADIETREHFHVVSFIDGCLNDYDDGPYDSLQVARGALDNFLDANDDESHPWVSSGIDRYVQKGGPYVLTIESCTESNCYLDN